MSGSQEREAAELGIFGRGEEIIRDLDAKFLRHDGHATPHGHAGRG